MVPRYRLFKGFSVLILLLTAVYVWLVLQSGGNILDYIAILFALLTTVASYIAGSKRLIERFNTRWEWAWGFTLAFIFGFQLTSHGSMILGDIRSGRQFELATPHGYGLLIFTLIFALWAIILSYGYFNPEILSFD